MLTFDVVRIASLDYIVVLYNINAILLSSLLAYLPVGDFVEDSSRRSDLFCSTTAFRDWFILLNSST
jgi:hypothetical protein